MLLTALFLNTGHTSPANKTNLRTNVVLRLPENASVADLFAKIVDGKKTFSLPDTPQFARSYEEFPHYQYAAEYTAEAGTITLDALMRFINQGHTLFKDKSSQENYSKMLKTAIDCRALWGQKYPIYKTFNTPENWAAVLTAQENVYAHLKQLPLSDPRVKRMLEEILSTPTDQSTVKNILHSLLFPFRSKVVKDKETNKPIIKLSYLASFTSLTIYLSGAIFAFSSADYFRINNAPISERIARWVSYFFWIMTVVSWLLNSHNTSIRLSPEPENGINVTINLTDD